MAEVWILMAALAEATFIVRRSGVFVGQSLPQQGPWARALSALPGCLIVSLVSVALLSGGPREWAAGAVATLVAVVTRNLPATMIAGVLTVWFLRQI